MVHKVHRVHDVLVDNGLQARKLNACIHCPYTPLCLLHTPLKWYTRYTPYTMCWVPMSYSTRLLTLWYTIWTVVDICLDIVVLVYWLRFDELNKKKSTRSSMLCARPRYYKSLLPMEVSTDAQASMTPYLIIERFMYLHQLSLNLSINRK